MKQPFLPNVFFFFIFTALPLFPPCVHAQDLDEPPPWSFLPEGGPFLQLPSNPEEPRTGIRKEIGSSRMRLDVGTQLDLVQMTCSPDDQFRLGLIIFAYALTTSSQGLRLQIDALDGFFGAHLTFRKKFDGLSILARVRILHRSAHFVDGHIDHATGLWIDGRAPIPFTRDYGEILGVVEFHLPAGFVKAYSGISYATLVRPTNIERVAGFMGFDYRTDDSFSSVFGRPFLFYAGYQLVLTGIPAYVGTSVIEGGVKFGGWQENGVRVFTSYSAGLEVFGQYHDVKSRFWQIGFSLDLL